QPMAGAAVTDARIAYNRLLDEFKILLGYSTDVELDLNPPEELPEISVNIDKARQLALKNNSESLNYKFREMQSDRDLARAKGEARLGLTLNAEYGLNQTSRDFADLYKDPENRQFISLGFEVP